MAKKSFARRLRDLFRNSRQLDKAHRRQRFMLKLGMEQLEDRRLLAVRVWDGAGSNANMSTAANWVGNVVPLADDSLVFPTAAHEIVNDDLAAGTRFHSISFEGGGYTLSGNGITVLEGIATGNATGTNTLNLPVTLGASQTWVSGNSGTALAFGTSGTIDTGDLLVLTFDGAGNFNLGGVISDEGSLVKYGSGTAYLMAANTYDGQTTVDAGVVDVENNSALGSNAAGTYVSPGGALDIGALNSGANFTINEPLAINGQGIGTGTDDGSDTAASSQADESQLNNANYTGLGGLLNVSGSNTLTGGIQLEAGTTYIGVGGSSTLNVASSITSNTPEAENYGMAKVGTGDLILSGTTDNLVTGTTTVLQGTLELDKTGGALPFHGALIIGDNIQGNNASVVKLDAPNQIPYADYFGTTGLILTINSSGDLNLNNYNDVIGALVMEMGQTYSANVSTGTGVLTILGVPNTAYTTAYTITVNDNEGTNPVTSPAATISGNIDLGNPGDYFSGGALGLQEPSHYFVVNSGAIQTMTTAVNPATGTVEGADLWISAKITGAADESITKEGAGTLLLTGNNTYQGSTILLAGYTAIGSNTAFGNGGTVSLAGGTLTTYSANPASPTPITISNPISLDNTATFYGTTPITFTALATLTASRTLDIVDPTETVTFAGGITESVFGTAGAGLTLAKSGEGTLALTGTNTYSGSTTINNDGGTIDLSGNGTLLNSIAITVGENGELVLDDSLENFSTTPSNPGRLNGSAAITLSGGELLFIGNDGGASNQTLGNITLTAGDSSTIASQLGVGASSSNSLLLSNLTVNAGASVSFIGGNSPLSGAVGAANQIILGA
ncbi:MAG TPA: autotransporter-associated beta strand repeat-containing protein, partial [Pirellulales bacterium]